MRRSKKFDEMSIQDRGFYSGVITCLAVIKEADEEVLFDEIMRLLDINELLEVAKHEDEVQFSGLVKYGYVDSAGKRLRWSA